MPHVPFIIFVFVLGACVGSFLNVVVWRVPRGGWGSLISPPSHCPKCEHRLAWYDNIPVLGWICLGGKCRYCHAPISMRYPLVEFATGAIFAFYYVMFFMLHISPAAPQQTVEFSSLFSTFVITNRQMTNIQADWPMYVLYMALIAGLLAASLIDFELFIIPSELPWGLAVIGLFAHAVIDRPMVPGR